MNDFEQKQAQLQALLDEKQLEGLLLRRVSSFAWATDGAASYVNTAATEGAASLLVTRAGRQLITNNIEAPRLVQEEALADQGWELQTAPWYQAGQLLADLTAGLKLGADVPLPGAMDLSGDIARLRARLTPTEGQRFAALGRLSAEAMQAAVNAVQPGQTEFEIAALVGQQVQQRGAQPIVNLVATDERIFQFRHPLPTAKTLDKYAMLVLCARQRGLVCSITRLVHFGRLPDEVRRKAEAVAHIDAAFIAATRPGQTLGEIFEQATAAYARTGFASEWQLHHQGGATGYEPREYLATPGSRDTVAAGQAFAWNPSIAGVKSEDTMLVTDSGYRVLTELAGWPVVEVSLEGQVIPRPAILEIM